MRKKMVAILLLMAVSAVFTGCGHKNLVDAVKNVTFPSAEPDMENGDSKQTDGAEVDSDAGDMEEITDVDEIKDADDIETYEQAVAYMNSLDKSEKSEDIIRSSFESNKIQVDDMVFNTGMTMTFSEVDSMVKAAGYDIYKSEAEKFVFDDYEKEKLNEFKTWVVYKNGDNRSEGILFYFYCNREFPDPDESSHRLEGYMPEDDDLLTWAGPYDFNHYWMEKVYPYDFPDVDNSKRTMYYPHGITYYDLYTKEELIEMIEGDGGVYSEDGDNDEPGITYSIDEWENGEERTALNIFIHEHVSGDDGKSYKYSYWYIFEEIADTGKFGLNAVNGGQKSDSAIEYMSEHNL